MANLTGFVQIPAAATVGGAPIDSFQGDAFRINDDTFNAALSKIAQVPFLRNDLAGGAGVNPSSITSMNAVVTDICTISSQLNATPGVPLIIIATTSITINADIVATGASVPATSAITEGNVGGSGGGGAAAGGDIVMPLSKFVLTAGGGVNTAGNPSNLATLLRFMNMLPMMLGGARGGSGGGFGGGIVVLAAPTITLSGGKVKANGAPGVAAGSGGGGGGAIVVMATTTNGFVPGDFILPLTPTDNFQVNGGAGNGSGGTGGAGLRIFYPMP